MSSSLLGWLGLAGRWLGLAGRWLGVAGGWLGFAGSWLESVDCWLAIAGPRLVAVRAIVDSAQWQGRWGSVRSRQRRWRGPAKELASWFAEARP